MEFTLLQNAPTNQIDPLHPPFYVKALLDIANPTTLDGVQMPLSLKKAYEITGSKSEAELLRRVSFWDAKATIERDGKVWFIKTAKEFREEGVIYSEITIKRALKSLREKGFIEIIHTRHLFKSGPHSSWIRLKKTDEELLSLIE